MPQTNAGRTLERLLAGQRGIFIHRAFIDTFGLTTAAFLDQAIYWTPRSDADDGWFWKSRDEWKQETGLSRREQETARASLRSAALLREESRGGTDRTLYFRIDLDAVAELLLNSEAVPAEGSHVTDGTAIPGPSKRQKLPAHGPELADVKGTQPTSQPTSEKEMVSTNEKVWSAVLDDLTEQIVPANFTRWLARTSLLSRTDGTAVVGVPDQASADQLAKRFDPLVRRALSDACGEAVTVQYQVVEG